MLVNRKTRFSILFFILAVVGAVFIGCAPRQTSSDASEPEFVATIPEWSMQSDCATCHSSSESSRSAAADLASSGDHATAACIMCHDDEPGLQDAHKDAETAPTQEITRLRKSSVSNESCLSCHDSVEVASLTAVSTVLTDKDGTTVDPHNLPANEEHTDINCGSCHIMHKPAQVDEDAYKLCTGCHHQEIFIGCETCHGPGGV